VGLYATVEEKEQDTGKFYRELKRSTDKIPKKENIILTGDFNGRIGNQPIPECIRPYGEQVTNHNGAALRDFLHCINLKQQTHSTDIKTYTNLLGRQEGPSQ